jgi:hypothetical protein
MNFADAHNNYMSGIEAVWSDMRGVYDPSHTSTHHLHHNLNHAMQSSTNHTDLKQPE